VQSDFNILISSAGRRVALLRIFKQTLEEMGLRGDILAVDTSRMSAAFQLADCAIQVPYCTSDEFIPTMLEICRLKRVRFLIPTIDPELPVYAAHRAEFQSVGTTLCISSPEVIAIGMDKNLTHSWLLKHELPTVRQASVESVLANQSVWNFPVIVKPVRGSSSIGVSIVHNAAELSAATRDGEYIVQTLAPGAEYTLDLLADRNGRCVCSIPRRRYETRMGEVSKGMTVKDKLLLDCAAKFCSALPGAYGVLNFQLFWDSSTDAINIIELNPRFGGGFPLAWEAGGKYPQWMIEELLGIPSTASMSCWKDRLVMLRYDDAVFVDAERLEL
jgi:carbamoyl-phosphate synthase large subunit